MNRIWTVALKAADILLVPLAIILVLLVRAIAPLVLIRFGMLIGERIGHFAANTEHYLCLRDEGAFGKRTIDIFYCTAVVSNLQLKKMIGQVLIITPYARILDRVNRLIPGGERHVIRFPSDRAITGQFFRKPAHLSFTEDEIERGRTETRSMRIPDGAPYVCLYMRDSSYLVRTFPGRDTSYHNYRDVDVGTYLAAAEELTKRGYFVIRMGAIVKEPLKTNNPMIIDYSTKFRTDFLDIYLCATCVFFLGSEGGLTSIPMIFRRPIAWANCCVIEHVPSYNKYDILITKKMKDRKSGRFLTYQEIIASGIGRYKQSCQYEKAGVDIIDNTSEEITDLVKEMDDFLCKRWSSTEEEDKLQKLFWSHFRNSDLHDVIVSRVCSKFLLNNKELLIIGNPIK